MRKDPNITWKRVDATSLDLSGWKVAVVGGTGGFGRAITRVLASRGASVTVVGHTFRDKGVPGIECVKADLSLLREAEQVAKALPAEELDLVLFTTGIFAAPKRQETAEGIERDMAVSYLNRLVMLRELAPRLGKGRSTERARRKPRVFVMGYPGAGQAGRLGDLNADKSYSAMAVHMNTVAGNKMLVLDAAKRHPHATFFEARGRRPRREVPRGVGSADSACHRMNRAAEAAVRWMLKRRRLLGPSLAFNGGGASPHYEIDHGFPQNEQWGVQCLCASTSQ